MTNANATSDRAWARSLCEQWNWNADIAEIAQELIRQRVHPSGDRFAVLKEEFQQFFKQPKMDCIEAVEQVMETFGDFDLGGE